MFPLFKYSSSSITFYFYCVQLLQINFTVNPITPIAYIPWQWSDQFKISWEKRLFSKVTHTLGKLYYANKFTYIQQKSVQLVWVDSALWLLLLQWHKMRSGWESGFLRLCIYEVGKKEWPADFFFPKQLWHLPVDQGKNQIIPNPSVPHQHHRIIKRRHLKGFGLFPTFKMCTK